VSQNVNVYRNIEFVGDANQESNIKGHLCTEKMTTADYFQGKALDTTYDYTVTVGGTSDAVAFTAAGYPGLTMTTGTGDNEICFVANGLAYDISAAPAAEARVKIADVSGTTFFFGFASATSDTTPEAFIDADSGTVVAGSGITDAVGFVCDADLGTSSLYCASVKTSGTAQTVDTAIDWSDNQTKNLRVELDTSGNARFFVDGLQKGYIASAVADVPLCVGADAGTRANDGANLVYIRYIKTWQNVL
jgi:hypothetical protein